MGASASTPSPSVSTAATNAAPNPVAVVADPGLDIEEFHRDEWPALSRFLSIDPESASLPNASDSTFWEAVFRQLSLSLAEGTNPVPAIAAESVASTHFAGSAALSLRAALRILRVSQRITHPDEKLKRNNTAADALQFAAELVRALRNGCGRLRAETLGTLDGGTIRANERADIGAAALWQLGAAALDRICALNVPSIERAAACMVVFAFVSDPPGDGAHALPRIVERYPNPSLVVASLLRVALQAAESTGDPEVLLALDPERVVQPVSARPAAAAALAGAVAALAATFSPRAIAALAITPRVGAQGPSVGSATTPANGFQAVSLRLAAENARTEIHAASDALCLLLTLVACGGKDGAYRSALLALRDSETPAVDTSFVDVYRTLCFWAVHPAGALLAETLLCGNRKFRAYALARTDPDTLLVPLLRALHERCGPPSPAADAYAPAGALLSLSSDPGFCEAVDKVGVSPAECVWADPRGRFGASSGPVPLSALVLFVGARAVQQSLLVKRNTPETYTAGLVLATMANVAAAATALHPPAADRLVSLLEFLGRRACRAESSANSTASTSVRVDRPVDAPRPPGAGAVVLPGGRERSASDVCVSMAAFVGTTLEVIAGVLRSRGDVSASRHLVYALLHREHLVRQDAAISKLSPQCAALCARLERVVRYFGAQVDRVQPDLSLAPGDGGAVLSVERVFAVIDETARLLPREYLAGLPQLRFEYRPMLEEREIFFTPAAWSIVRRFAKKVAYPEEKAPPEVVDALRGS